MSTAWPHKHIEQSVDGDGAVLHVLRDGNTRPPLEAAGAGPRCYATRVRTWLQHLCCLLLTLTVACTEKHRAKDPPPSDNDAAAMSDAAMRDSQADADATYISHVVRFDPPAGTFTELPTVNLEATGHDVQLYYTTDGSLPTEESTAYTEPFQLQSSALVRVASYRDGEPILYSSASYIAIADDMLDFNSNLPVLLVHMQDGKAPDAALDVHVPGVVQVRMPNETGRTQLAGPAGQHVRIGIKVHGRRTRNQEKKSFNLELRSDHNDDDDEHVQLLDLPPQSDWVLYAPFELDRAIIRNSLFYELSRSIGRYAARTRFVEVFLAAEGQHVDRSKYIGLYVVIESVKRDRQRVAIEKLDNSQSELPAISGGYLLRADESDPGEKRIVVANHPREFVLRYPRRRNVNTAQQHYIADYLNTVGRASGAPDRVDPETGQALDELIDRESFIDIHLLNLFVKNSDAWRLSAYYHKPRNQKLRAGPVWDCDRCMGSYDGRSIDPQGWLATGSTVDYFSYGFWAGIFSDPTFEQQYWARLEQLLEGPFATEAVSATIDRLTSELDEATARNAERYPQAAPMGSFHEEVEDLRKWFTERIRWTKANLRKR